MSSLTKSATNPEVEHLEENNATFGSEVEMGQQSEAMEKIKTNKKGLTLVPQPSDDPRDPLVSLRL